MSSNFEHRKIQILETPGVKYQDSTWEAYPKVLRLAIKSGEISYQAGWLWLTISELAGHDREAYSGQEYLADALGTSVPTIKRWTKELEQTGWLVKQNRTATSNKYWLSIPMEYDVLAKDYVARLSTVGQELTTGKRSTKAKNPPAEEGYSHKLILDPMDLDNTNSSHKLTDEPSHKLTDELIDKLTDEPLKRQSIKYPEHNDPELSSYQGVTYLPEENQGSSLAKTLDSPMVSSGETIEEIAVLPLVETNVLGDLEEVVVSSGTDKVSLGYSSVTSKEEAISSGMAIVNEDDLGREDRVAKALEEYRAKKEKRSACAPGYRKVPQKVVDAPQSLVEASGAEKVQTVPEKPQKPVQHVPERSPWDDDASYGNKVHRADVAFTMAMGKWRQDLLVWEKTYGNTTNSSDSPSTDSTTPTPVFKAVAY